MSITLSPDGDGARADVVTDLAVTGKPAQFGRGVMQDVSDKLLQAFVACIEKQLTGPSGEPEAAPVAAAAPSGAAAPAGAPAPAGPNGYVETGSDALAADTRSTGPASVAPVAPAPPTVHPPRRVPSDVEEDAPLDLGSAVMPVLIQRYAGYAAAAAIGVVIGWLLGRGSRS